MGLLLALDHLIVVYNVAIAGHDETSTFGSKTKLQLPSYSIQVLLFLHTRFPLVFLSPSHSTWPPLQFLYNTVVHCIS